MARPFVIGVTLQGVDRLSPTVETATARLKVLEQEVKDVGEQFRKGEISAEKYQKSIDRVDKEIDQLNAGLKKSEGSLKRFSRSFSNFATTIRARALGIAASIAALAGAFRALEKAANLEGQRRSLAINLKQQGEDLDAFLDKLKTVSRGAISEADLVASASRALLLGIPAKEIAELLEIAGASATAFGISVGAAFDRITTGIGRSSPLLLDDLGIVINLSDAYGAAADKIGTTVESLTQAQRSTALLNGVLDIGRQRVALFGEAHSQSALAVQQGKAAIDDFTTILGGAFGRVVAASASALTLFTAALSEIGRGLVNLIKLFTEAIELIPGFGGAFDKMQSKLSDANDAMLEFSNNASELGVRLLASAVATADATAGLENIGTASADASNRLGELAGNIKLTESEFELLGIETDETTGTVRDFENEILTAGSRLDELRAKLAGVREETAAVNAELSRFSANAITGGSSDFAQVGGGQFTTIAPLPSVDGSGRVIVPGVGRIIANPDFVRT